MNNNIEAFYSDQFIEEYAGNPFIEALPPIMTKEQVIDSISFYPKHNDDNRLLDDSLRIHLISQKLTQVFQPLTRHIELERKISLMIRLGYVSRNPTTKDYTKSLIGGYKDINKINYSSNNNVMTANSVSVIGVSGLGKTSSINRILNTIPQTIKHEIYKGNELNIIQVTWIKIDCTFDGSVKGLLLEFFSKVDSIVGTTYFEKYGTGKRTTDTLLSIMAQVCRNIGLGILVIDEIQHLSQAKSGGAEKMLNFFTTLVNVVGIPIVMVGTMAAKGILQNDFRMARRNLGYEGNVVWDRLDNDESWELLIDALWEYQYTKKKSSLNKEIKDLLYFESQGIVDVVIKIISMAQITAISTGEEEITVDIIKRVVNKNMTAIKPMINALKSGDIRKIANYRDICTQEYEEVLKERNKDIDLKIKLNEYKEAKKKKRLNKKEEALKELLKLDINKKKAIVAIDNVLSRDNDIPVNKLIIESIKEVENVKLTDKKEVRFNDGDIRKIVRMSKDNQLAYEMLIENNYICNADCEWRKDW